MQTIINRLYENQEKAEAIAAKLIRGGARSESVMVTRSADAAGLRRLGISALRTDAYLDEMSKGAVLVTALAPGGSAYFYLTTMRAAGPIARADLGEYPDGIPSASAAPFAEMLGVESFGGSGEMFSRMLGLPTLIERSPLKDEDFRKGNAPYRPTIPMPMLSGGGAPYKGALGSSLLSGSGGSYRPVIPMPMLSGSGAPYKGFLGLPLLSGAKRYLYY